MSGGTGRFRRADRIQRSRDFQRIGRVGERRASGSFVLLVARSRDPEGPRRLGVTVSRRVGNAVTRNRVKRGIREWFRQRRGVLEPGIDVVVIARAPAARLSPGQMARELDGLLPAGVREGR